MKCMSISFEIDFILLLLLLSLNNCCATQGGTNCYESHQNGFNTYPNNLPGDKGSGNSTNNNNDTTMMMTQAPGTTTTPSSNDVATWTCCCWEVSNQNELECRCEGDALTRVPQTLQQPLQRLTIASAGMPRLRSVGLKIYGATLLDVAFINCHKLEEIQDSAFSNLTVLRTIYISQAPKLTYLSKNVFEGISDTIEIIRIINSGLTSVPDLGFLPPLNILQMIDLDNNQISRIDSKSIKVKTAQLVLANNDITFIDDSAFSGSKIAKLTLRDNRKLSDLHPNAFYGIIDITELDLSSTSLVSLPSAGLQTVEVLYITNTHTLKTIPSIYNFQNLQKAHLTHSFHCCAFQFPSRHDPLRHAQRMQELEKLREQCYSNRDLVMQLNKPNLAASQTDEVVDQFGRWERSIPNGLNDFVSYQNTEMPLNDGTPNSYNYLTDSTMINIGVFHEQITLNPEDDQLAEYCGNFTFRKPNVECYPMPNALNPCEDVMGYQWLRIAVWIVVALAVVGNVAVLTVILSIKSETASVPRFLMCHLAFADLCLGLYLLLIASIDAHSMGEYFNYAFDWQYGLGCKVAGFLTVFASHLSVFTLTVITIERWFTITHAMYLNKRLKLYQAAVIMLSGWIYSIFMSSMPLFGISNYSSTSICLPMEKRDIYDSVYLVLILGCNFMAFTIIAICYAQIYISLGHETRHARDNIPGEISIAKKMTLLVFTNFTCWAPIAFFGLTALAGYPLINVTKSKILLVFFYPLNSCADPYLYAILTSQYRQDLITLLSKLGICQKRLMKYKHSDSIPVTTHYTIRGSIDRHHSLSQKGQLDLTAETQKMIKNDEAYV
ncbi:lutropin-choriogonadotropic hormone receptor isoform X1 [Drosophila nasuta]|uniref:lutropin-choriogonadotropic hormone receptor isoform X1 n=2 Tax=Drosophila nasuta TaxID=42062 RepID=UPI00295EE939|nr:lutropin-choriogonadotropic hormone receptor isoform X1 [Drosophila nasuta]XP_060648907.1 lutropin-choriogonadotropic hormone receptor isoform X1 [Drosophila nasuta]